MFKIWVANKVDYIRIDNNIQPCFMQMPRDIFNEDERNLIWDRHKVAIDEANDSELQAKKEQLKRLKEELGEI